jgi:hypothetical protein
VVHTTVCLENWADGCEANISLAVVNNGIDSDSSRWHQRGEGMVCGGEGELRGNSLEELGD